ncbi:MAG: DUF4115 domain-containing protein [Neisseriaceae bacterium]|nr:DUF4115 domain-containing protein [Neisseriaceae bacterium]
MSDVEQKQTTETAPVNDAVLPLGEKLKQARLNKGLSVGEVAERLKLGVTQVDAMEASDPSRFPEPVFARGFFRSYARFLQLNEADVLADLNKMFPSERVAVNHGQNASANKPISVGRAGSGKKLPKWLWMAGLVVVIVGVAVAWPKGDGEEVAADADMPLAVGELAAPQVEPVAPVVAEGVAEGTEVTVAPAETDEATVAAVGNEVLVVNIASRSMLTVKNKDGEVLMSKIVPARSEHRFEGGAPYDVRIGYARGASMTFNDEAVDLTSAFVDKTTAATTVPAANAAAPAAATATVPGHD